MAWQATEKLGRMTYMFLHAAMTNLRGGGIGYDHDILTMPQTPAFAAPGCVTFLERAALSQTFCGQRVCPL